MAIALINGYYQVYVKPPEVVVPEVLPPRVLPELPEAPENAIVGHDAPNEAIWNETTIYKYGAPLTVVSHPDHPEQRMFVFWLEEQHNAILEPDGTTFIKGVYKIAAIAVNGSSGDVWRVRSDFEDVFHEATFGAETVLPLRRNRYHLPADQLEVWPPNTDHAETASFILQRPPQKPELSEHIVPDGFRVFLRATNPTPEPNIISPDTNMLDETLLNKARNDAPLRFTPHEQGGLLMDFDGVPVIKLNLIDLDGDEFSIDNPGGFIQINHALETAQVNTNRLERIQYWESAPDGEPQYQVIQTPIFGSHAAFILPDEAVPEGESMPQALVLDFKNWTFTQTDEGAIAIGPGGAAWDLRWTETGFDFNYQGGQGFWNIRRYGDGRQESNPSAFGDTPALKTINDTNGPWSMVSVIYPGMNIGWSVTNAAIASNSAPGWERTDHNLICKQVTLKQGDNWAHFAWRNAFRCTIGLKGDGQWLVEGDSEYNIATEIDVNGVTFYEVNDASQMIKLWAPGSDRSAFPDITECFENVQTNDPRFLIPDNWEVVNYFATEQQTSVSISREHLVTYLDINFQENGAIIYHKIDGENVEFDFILRSPEKETKGNSSAGLIVIDDHPDIALIEIYKEGELFASVPSPHVFFEVNPLDRWVAWLEHLIFLKTTDGKIFTANQLIEESQAEIVKQAEATQALIANNPALLDTGLKPIFRYLEKKVTGADQLIPLPVVEGYKHVNALASVKNGADRIPPRVQPAANNPWNYDGFVADDGYYLQEVGSNIIGKNIELVVFYAVV